MSWDDIDFEFRIFSRRFEFVVEKIAEICTSNSDNRSRRNELSYVPEVKDVPIERMFKQVVWMASKNRPAILEIGAGYHDKNALAERTYSMHRGIAYNYSDWRLINERA